MAERDPEKLESIIWGLLFRLLERDEEVEKLRERLEELEKGEPA